MKIIFLLSLCAILHGEALGILNNNPGNVSVDSIKEIHYWKGATGIDSWHHLRFDTPEQGAEALLRNLRCYRSRHGLHTVRQIIGRWVWLGAPKAEKEAYIAFVSRRLKVSPDFELDLSDRDTRISVARSIARYECGQEFRSEMWWRHLP